MRGFSYTIIGNKAYLIASHTGSADTLEISTDSYENGTLRIGKITVKMQEGVGRVKFSELNEGIYVPELIFDGKVISLCPISVNHGIISLHDSEAILADISGRVADAVKRVSVLEDNVKSLNDAVFGTKIF